MVKYLDILSELNTLLDRYGFLGVFLLSLAGNAIPYSTIPYLLFVTLYASSLNDPLKQLAVTLSSGIGAALGKVIVYYFGFGIRYAIPEEMRRNLETFTRLFRNSTFIAVLIFAASPLPDDILYIPLGAMKYSLKKYIIALTTGKIFITGVAVYGGSTIKNLLSYTTKYPDYITIPILFIISLYIMYLAGKLDWFKLAKLVARKKFVKATIYLFREVFRITLELLMYPIRALRRK
jgi:membrane protein DedA with SNARE-associated domain